MSSSRPLLNRGVDRPDPLLLQTNFIVRIRAVFIPQPMAGSRFADALDGAKAAVRNAQWREVICAESLEARA